MHEFSCETRQVGDLVAVSLGGEVDIATRRSLLAEVAGRLAPAARVVLDCSRVTFLDSSGLQGLLEVKRAAAAAGAVFALAAPSRPVARILELSGTRRAFTVLDGVPEF